FVASAQIKDEVAWIVFLQGKSNEIHNKGFPATGASGKESMAHIVAAAARRVLDTLMEIEIERRAIDGFHDGQGLAVEIGVPSLAFMQGKQERPVGIVIVRNVELAEIEMAVAGACGEKC